MKTDILLFGAGLHVHTCIDIIEKNSNYRIVGIIDSVKEIGSFVDSYKVIGRIENLKSISESLEISHGFISIGTNWAREKVLNEIRSELMDFEFVNLIHPSAVFGKNIKLGKGILIGALAFLSSNCEIGNFCLIHQKSHLGLDNKMGEYSSISLGSVTGGKVSLGERSAVTLRVTVNDRIKIGSDSVIGSGSLVIKDIPNNIVAYGQPAKFIRSRSKTDPYLKSG